MIPICNNNPNIFKGFSMQVVADWPMLNKSLFIIFFFYDKPNCLKFYEQKTWKNLEPL